MPLLLKFKTNETKQNPSIVVVVVVVVLLLVLVVVVVVVCCCCQYLPNVNNCC